jgi:UDP-N-acetyl-D-mannosaminuronate dehydrogenase
MTNVAHCLERVLPVRLVRELIENDRIIDGMTQTRAADHAPAVYRVFLQGVLVARSRFSKSREKKRCALSSSTSPV